MTQTLLARKALFDRVGRFDPGLRVGDTTDWFLRASEQGTVIELLSEVLVYRRMHESNMSMEPGSQLTPSMQSAILRVVKASLDRRRKDGAEAVQQKVPAAAPGK